VINHQIGVGAMTIELDIDIDQVTASATDVCADPTDMIDRLPVFSVSLSSLNPGSSCASPERTMLTFSYW
jgi:hypothetical protein